MQLRDRPPSESCTASSSTGSGAGVQPPRSFGSFTPFPVPMTSTLSSQTVRGHSAVRTGSVPSGTRIRRAGVDREVLVEGRLVMAGTLADEGNIEEAIELLRPEGKLRRNPDLAHLRQWYALADLYERAGDRREPESSSPASPMCRRTSSMHRSGWRRCAKPPIEGR